MKTKILVLFLSLGIITLQVEAQGLFKKSKNTKQQEQLEKLSWDDDELDLLLGGEDKSSSPSVKKQNKEISLAPAKKSSVASQSSEDEVTLVVSADGATKDEATKVALRSAIEQAYGTFVSANTTILNDELVEDEIVTIASGNIKGYKEIASNVMPDGKTFVTLQATVCISKLVSYAQSKGAETEFAGATFGMNMKMKELNKQNEMKALQNLLVQVKELLPVSFEKKLIVKDPIVTDKESLGKMCSPEGLAFNYTQEKGETRDQSVIQSVNKWMEGADESYLMEFELQFAENDNTLKLMDLISSTLGSLSLTREEEREYRQLKMKVYELDTHSAFRIILGSYLLRNSKKDIENWCNQLYDAFYEEYDSYKIVDNNGTESYFNGLEMIKKVDSHYNVMIRNPIGEVRIAELVYETGYLTEGYGLFSPYFMLGTDLKNMYINSHYVTGDRLNLEKFSWVMKFLLPKADISKYSNFRVERKQ